MDIQEISIPFTGSEELRKEVIQVLEKNGQEVFEPDHYYLNEKPWAYLRYVEDSLWCGHHKPSDTIVFPEDFIRHYGKTIIKQLEV